MLFSRRFDPSFSKIDCPEKNYGDYQQTAKKDNVESSLRAVVIFLERTGIPIDIDEEIRHFLNKGDYISVMLIAQECAESALLASKRLQNSTKSPLTEKLRIMVELFVSAWASLSQHTQEQHREAYREFLRLRMYNASICGQENTDKMTQHQQGKLSEQMFQTRRALIAKSELLCTSRKGLILANAWMEEQRATYKK